MMITADYISFNNDSSSQDIAQFTTELKERKFVLRNVQLSRSTSSIIKENFIHIARLTMYPVGKQLYIYNSYVKILK